MNTNSTYATGLAVKVRAMNRVGHLAILTVLTLLTTAWQVAAQVCPETDYELLALVQVDALPGGCAEVTGALRVSGSGITNLLSLAALTTGHGSVPPESNPGLTNVGGLAALARVGGDLTMRTSRSQTINIFLKSEWRTPADSDAT
jgi:hypothetical protein